MPVVSQSIIRPIVPVGARTLACALRTPWSLGQLESLVPDGRGGRQQAFVDFGGVDVRRSPARCLANDPQHAGGVFFIAGLKGPTFRAATLALDGVGVAGHHAP